MSSYRVIQNWKQNFTMFSICDRLKRSAKKQHKAAKSAKSIAGPASNSRKSSNVGNKLLKMPNLQPAAVSFFKVCHPFPEVVEELEALLPPEGLELKIWEIGGKDSNRPTEGSCLIRPGIPMNS